MYLFFDTETNGLPKMKLSPMWVGQPDLVQLAAILTDDTGEEQSCFDCIIKPGGRFTIPDDLAKLHGISTERAVREGIEPLQAIKAFSQLYYAATSWIAHNAEFDILIMKTFYSRQDVEFPKILSWQCTLEMCKPILKIPPTPKMIEFGYGNQYKNPNLTECYKHFFGKGFERAHNAIADVRATRDVFFAARKYLEDKARG